MRDCIVVGAGPAGMAAATLLAERGADVVVLDEQAAPGGQIWRGVERATAWQLGVLGEDYAAGAAVVARFRASGARYLPGSSVWNVTPEREVWASRDGTSSRLQGRTVLLAVGAMERAVPVPGWTLPGVMGAGGVQILLKSAGLVPQGVVLAGNGPLLYLLAAQLIAAGAPPVAVLDTAQARDQLPALRRLGWQLRWHPPWAMWPYLRKGLMLQGAIRAAGIPWYRAVTGLRLLGEDRVRAVRFQRGGETVEIAADLVALHEGVIPASHAARAVGADHIWNDGQASFLPELDEEGNTRVAGILVAGDAGWVGGAQAALHSGRIAALSVLHQLGRLSWEESQRLAAADRRAWRGHMAIRPFLNWRYRPTCLVPADEVIVCRCEEVTAGELRRAVAQGAQGPNQAKAFTRAGMGACQGRMCGTTVAAVMAEALGRSPGEVGHGRVRPPLKPLTVGELAEAKEESSFF
jgi:NADPH-dependent 2,4-dienoyl-CoA reductase/sulfur reductase-like enzyme